MSRSERCAPKHAVPRASIRACRWSVARDHASSRQLVSHEKDLTDPHRLSHTTIGKALRMLFGIRSNFWTEGRPSPELRVAKGNSCLRQGLQTDPQSILGTASTGRTYTISRREADSLGPRVERCTQGMYELLRKMYDRYSSQMQTRIPFDISTLDVSGQVITFDCIRAVIESASIGGHHFISSGEIETIEQTGPAGQQIAIQDRRKFDAGRKTR